jgi:hypothetical protein
MRGNGGGEIVRRKRSRRVMISTTGKFAHQLIMVVATFLRPPWGPTPGF